MGESAIDITVDHPQLAALPYWRAMARRGVPPHVTLLYPWRPSPVASASIAAAADALRDFEPFTLRVTGVDAFPSGVVYGVVEPDALIRRIARCLYDAFPDTPPYGGTFEGTGPVPHVTLAKCDPNDLALVASTMVEACAGMFPLAVPVDSVAIEEESDTGVWSVTTTLPLAR